MLNSEPQINSLNNNVTIDLMDNYSNTIYDISGVNNEYQITDTEEEPVEETPDSIPEEILAQLDILVEEAHAEIPVNSESLKVSETTSRFSSAIWYDKIKTKTVSLAGLGGIGSYTAFLLGRMQIQNLCIYDDDVVEVGNMSGQFYGNSHLGQSKVYATSNILKDFSNFYSIIGASERYTSENSPTQIMICGFDNMLARKIYFESWLNLVENSQDDKSKCLFIDGRLAAEEFQVFCIRGDDTFNIDRYMKEFLFKDAEADETICSYKQTTYMANMIGSIIVNLFTNFVANECEPLFDRDLPFITTYDAATMYFKTEI